MVKFKLKGFRPWWLFVTDKCRNNFQPIHEIDFSSRNENQAKSCLLTPGICAPSEQQQQPPTKIMKKLLPLERATSRVRFEIFPTHPFSAAVIAPAVSYPVAVLTFPFLRATVNVGKVQCWWEQTSKSTPKKLSRDILFFIFFLADNDIYCQELLRSSAAHLLHWASPGYFWLDSLSSGSRDLCCPLKFIYCITSPCAAFVTQHYSFFFSSLDLFVKVTED